MKRFSFILLTVFALFTFSEEYKFPLSEDKKNFYADVYEEAKFILDKNHFNKEIALINSEVLKEYINTIDSQKTIFTKNEFNSFSLKPTLNSKDEIDLAFLLFNYYKERSFSFFETQKDFIDDIKDEDDLNNAEFIFKNRENVERFRSYSQIKNYQNKLILSEFISVYLKEDDIKKTKAKLIKRINNREKSLRRISMDEVFSLYLNSYTSFFDPHTNYLTPTNQEDWEINLKASLEGIGAILSSEEGITKIIRLVPGGPAQISGLLKVTDKIVGVASSVNEEITDVRDWRIDEVVKLIRGPKSTVVKLEILPVSSVSEALGKIIEITRDIVKLEDAAAQKKEIEIKRSSRNYKIGVIELPTFYMDFEAYNKNRFDYKSSSRDVKKILRE